MPKLPFDSREREDPQCEDPPKKPRSHPLFVTHDEMNEALAELVREFRAPIRRIESMAKESLTESRAAKRERELRAQWDREQRESAQLDAIREKTKSETDLFKAQAEALAFQRTATPVMAFPIQAPPAPDSEPETPRKSRYNRTHVIGAIIAAITAISVAAIGAWSSQRSAPHGSVEPAPAAEHH